MVVVIVEEIQVPGTGQLVIVEAATRSALEDLIADAFDGVTLEQDQ